MVHVVIVPPDEARQPEAYSRQVALLCEPDRSCFLNFYTNSTGAALTMPLPDAVANEAVATFRRSMKQGAELFMWSCRLQLAQPDCF